MLGVGVTEMGLVSYLVGQLLLSEAARVDTLREFAPSAVDSDWELDIAGQRVQVIRRKGAGGVLEFGTTRAHGGRRQHCRSLGRLARRVHRGARRCSTCWSAASPIGTRAGCPS